MPLPPGGGVPVDWDAVVEQWRTELPADYREFMELYGAGSVNESFHVVWPTVPAALKGQHGIFDLASVTQLGRAQFGEEPTVFEHARDRICWAFDIGANRLYWETSSGDPNQWTVVGLAREGEWIDFACGMVEYMARLVAGEIDDPLMTLWDPETPAYERWELD